MSRLIVVITLRLILIIIIIIIIILDVIYSYRGLRQGGQCRRMIFSNELVGRSLCFLAFALSIDLHFRQSQLWGLA